MLTLRKEIASHVGEDTQTFHVFGENALAEVKCGQRWTYKYEKYASCET
jgi:hypothetical protein